MNYWFTSDLHLFHEMIIYLQPRPFWNLQEMHETIISRWNERVKPGDIVWVLGDFALGGAAVGPDVEKIYRNLHGEKFLIRGNHDMKNMFVKKLPWRWQGGLRDIKIGKQHIFLSHYSLRVWDKQGHGSWNLYGHSHSNLADNPNALAIDVGVDAQNYSPISFEEVAEIMSHKTWTPPEDHHGLLGEGAELTDQDLFDEWKALFTQYRSYGFLQDEERKRFQELSTEMRKRNILTLKHIQRMLDGLQHMSP